MHLAEGVLPLDQAIGWSVLAAPALVWSLGGERRARQETSSSPVLMAGATSLLFAATLLPLPVPVVG
ncbi:MAG: energy-coupling factor ABC transporter permease, partial [Myxococcota bacterium]